jgi:hypothetical protein
MLLTIDTNNLTEGDITILSLLGTSGPQRPPVGATAATTPKRRGPGRKTAERDEADTTDAAANAEPTQTATMDQAVAAATALLADGKTDLVKAALEAAGATRVSNLTDIDAFMAALDAS